MDATGRSAHVEGSHDDIPAWVDILKSTDEAGDA
jgi:hypothetical protein